MARDYVHLNRKSEKKYKKSGRKIWITLFVVILVLIVIVIMLANLKKDKANSVIDKKEALKKPDVKVSENKKKEDTRKQSIHFDFYKLLPQKKVDILQLNNTNKDTERYALQAAFVSNIDTANRIKTELVLLGFDVYINPQSLKSGKTGYTVNIESVLF